MPSKGKKIVAPSRKQNIVKESLPNWPPLTPLIPSIDIQLDTLLPDQIFSIHNLFTSSLCRNYVSFLSSLPLATTKIQPKRDEALRGNDRFQIDDPAFAQMLWTNTALHDLVAGASANMIEEGDMEKPNLEKTFGGKVLGLNPRIRIYRYGNSTNLHDKSRSVTEDAQERDNSLVNIVGGHSSLWSSLLI